MPARDPRLPPPLPPAPEANPYAAPSAVVADVQPGLSEAESVRQAHIRHERQIKSIGALYFLGAAVFAISTVVLGGTIGTAPFSAAFGTGMVAAYAVLAVISGTIGYGFRKLRPWVRIPGGIMSALGLLAFPLGTLVNTWALWAMFSAKGQVVLAPDYAAIIAATPHVRYRYSLGDKIATTILALIVLGIAAMFFMASRD